MNLAELISDYRASSNDTTTPYLWSDDQVIPWLNEAVDEACIRGRLIQESDNPTICQIAVVAGTSSYALHPSLYELEYVAFKRTGDLARNKLGVTSIEELDAYLPEWRELTDEPAHVIQKDKSIRIVPTPVEAGTLYLEGYRLPLAHMAINTDTPEIYHAHHKHLVHWALYRGFSVPDADAFDPARAEQALARFTQYFGIRPDSDLRRLTRADQPHHNKAWL